MPVTLTRANPRHVRLTLADTINPEELFGRKILLGTVEAVFRNNVHGQKELRLYRLIDVSHDSHASPMVTSTGVPPTVTPLAPITKPE